MYLSYWKLPDWLKCCMLDRKQARAMLPLNGIVCIGLSIAVSAIWKTWHVKEWARDKYSMRQSRVLYFVSRPLFQYRQCFSLCKEFPLAGIPCHYRTAIAHPYKWLNVLRRQCLPALYTHKLDSTSFFHHHIQCLI